MSYRGVNAVPLPELTSVRRMRESAGRLPDGSGFFTATVGTEEGGPGSGPQGGRHPKTKKPERAKGGYGVGQMPPKTIGRDVAKAASVMKSVPGLHSVAVAAQRLAETIQTKGEITPGIKRDLVRVYDKGVNALDKHEEKYGQTAKSDKALEHLDKLLTHAEAYGAKTDY